MIMKIISPLFIPITSRWFEEFYEGRKTTEFRPYGKRWNEKTCQVGREVTLSKGYGKYHRIRAIITGFEQSTEATKSMDWQAVYGERGGVAACIHMKILDRDFLQPLKQTPLPADMAKILHKNIGELYQDGA